MKTLFVGFVFVCVMSVLVGPYLPEIPEAKAQEARVEEAVKVERSDAQYESDAIQFCRDSVFERYRPTGGVGFDMGGTVYLKKGYGALVVGNGTAQSGKIRFKCTFRDRILTNIQVTQR